MFIHLAEQHSREGDFILPSEGDLREELKDSSCLCFFSVGVLSHNAANSCLGTGGGNKRRASHVKVVPLQTSKSLCPN